MHIDGCEMKENRIKSHFKKRSLIEGKIKFETWGIMCDFLRQDGDQHGNCFFFRKFLIFIRREGNDVNYINRNCKLYSHEINLVPLWDHTVTQY